MRALLIVLLVLFIAFTGVMVAIFRIESRYEDHDDIE